MLSYLLKATIIWGIFLLLFEMLYKRNTHFNANRIYLLLALITGALLPLIAMPLPGPVIDNDMVHGLSNVGAVAASPEITGAASNSTAINWKMLLKTAYYTGVLIFLILNFREVVLIIRSAVYGSYEEWNRHKIFTARKAHAPYSFMGWIFIQNPGQYNEKELDYILEHELAHTKNRHWLDVLMAQLFCILFWFHPLVWRYRYLLKLQHEYQADYEAAGADRYEYGHFLLNQTFLKGVPFIAHSFHFLPLKNRITMLTKNQGRMGNLWKYLAVLPALLCCTLLLAQTEQAGQRVRKGNITTFKGNTFEWIDTTSTDTILMTNSVTGEKVKVVARKAPAIIKSNGITTYGRHLLTNEAQYRQDKTFTRYLKDAIKRQLPTIPKGLNQIQVNNVVLNPQGKIIYYDLAIVLDSVSAFEQGAEYKKDKIRDLVSKVIEESPVWLPAEKDGKPVYEFLPTAAMVDLK